MAKRRIVLVSVCLIVGLFECVCGAKSAKQTTTKYSDPNVAMRAFGLRMAGQVAEAMELLEKAVAANPKNAAAQFELARVYFYTAGRTHDFEPAAKTIKKAIEANPDNPQAYYWSGTIATYNAVLKAKKWNTALGMPGEVSRARKAFEKAVELKPDFHQARFMLVDLYKNNPWFLGGSKSKAKKHQQILEQMSAKRDVGPGAALRNLRDNSKLFLDDEKYDEAEKLIKDYLNSEPAPPVALRAHGLMYLGRLQKMQGKDDDAIATMKKAKELDAYFWFTWCPPPDELFVAPPAAMAIRDNDEI